MARRNLQLHHQLSNIIAKFRNIFKKYLVTKSRKWRFDKMARNNAEIGLAIGRILLGLVFLIPGLMKLTNPSGIIGMLGSMGFPASALFGWVLLLSEIVFGLSLVIGWKVEWTAWPLVIVMAVAALVVYLPQIPDPVGTATFMVHLGVIGGLIAVALAGPGAWAIKA